MQTAPDKFAPPSFWGIYPPFSAGGQNSKINTAQPPPPWELGPGPADPNISAVAIQAPSGNGYGPVGQGTIGVGTKVTVQPQPPPAQVRLYVGADGKLYALDNVTGQAFAIASATPLPQPPVYGPTK
jgi:hypothetical protein